MNPPSPKDIVVLYVVEAVDPSKPFNCVATGLSMGPLGASPLFITNEQEALAMFKNCKATMDAAAAAKLCASGTSTVRLVKFVRAEVIAEHTIGGPAPASTTTDTGTHSFPA